MLGVACFGGVHGACLLWRQGGGIHVPFCALAAPDATQQCAAPPAQGSGGGGDADGLAERHDELMDSILLEEENLVAFHRAKLEEDMEAMRQEMALLQEVDKPGSNIDQYVEQMTALLEIKRQGIQELQVGSSGMGVPGGSARVCTCEHAAGSLAAAATRG